MEAESSKLKAGKLIADSSQLIVKDSPPRWESAEKRLKLKRIGVKHGPLYLSQSPQSAQRKKQRGNPLRGPKR
jgi:hypothetical protein